jgi:phosphoenolpyruvate carboxylase
MANRNLEKLASIDAQLRLLVPAKVSEDDKLIEYDALLLDRFLDILQDLHGEDLKETVSDRVTSSNISLRVSNLIVINAH